MTLYDLIFKAGGFVDEEYKKLTYLKRAELVRVREDSDEKEIIPFNLGQVLDKQGMANTVLRTDDAVRVYSVTEIEGATRYVSISGHVKRPATYELFEENMTAYDLIFKAGGFEDKEWKERAHLERADLLRLNDDQITRTISKINLGQLLESPKSSENFPLLPGDIIRVYNKNVFTSVKSITINGSVKKPGKYELKDRMCLKDIILEAGGISEHVYRYKVELARIDPDNQNADQFASIIHIEMNDDLCIIGPQVSIGETWASNQGMFFLHPYDVIMVRPDPKFKMQQTVIVVGAVEYPGTYVIQSSDESVTDIIERAGGILPEAFPFGSSFERAGAEIQMSYETILKNPKSNLNITVKGGDKITIREHPELIYLNGEVNSPGAYKYIPGKRLRYYIENAGGYSPDADKGNIFIQFASGTSHIHNIWSPFSPKVKDGSIITISKKPEEEPFDRTEFAKEVTTILANLAQAIAVVALASK
jgi:protein involved in polysaccharide export with SLBB domain